MLNQKYEDYAAAALQWPILLPRDREERNTVTKLANEMAIGSVKAGGYGGPSQLAYHTQKGFSIENLKRIQFARAILRSCFKDGEAIDFFDATSEDTEEANPPTAPSRHEFVNVTGIEHYEPKLLCDVRNLPDYDSSTSSEWIEQMLKMLLKNHKLIPPELSKRSVTMHTEILPNGKRITFPVERGGRLEKTLKDGLNNVTAIPGMWGD